MGRKPGNDLDDHISEVDTKTDAEGLAHGVGGDVVMMAMTVVAVVMVVVEIVVIVVIVVMIHDRVIHVVRRRWQRDSAGAAIEPDQIGDRTMSGNWGINFARRLHVIRGGQGFGDIFYPSVSNSVFWSSSRWR
jgi:heme exporter protein D